MVKSEKKKARNPERWLSNEWGGLIGFLYSHGIKCELQRSIKLLWILNLDQ
jgi:hypothetical protein